MRALVLGLFVWTAVVQPAWAQGDALDALNNEALKLYQQGAFKRGIKVAKRALALAERTYGRDHVDVASMLNNLAAFYVALGRYDAAAPLHRRALAIRKRALPPNHPHLATSLNNLAYAYQRQGNYDVAKPLFQRALAILRKTNGPNHPNVATALNNVAVIDEVLGRYRAAERSYRRALAIMRKARGRNHPDVATTLNNLAGTISAQGRLAEAEPLFKRALAIRERALGAGHTHVALSLNSLALLYESQGDYEAAEPLYKRSLAIDQKALGRNHTSVATTLNNLALLYVFQRRFKDAEALLQRSLAIREKALGPNHAEVAQSLLNLAGAYKAQDRSSSNGPLLRRALAIFEKALGPNHPSVAAALNRLAQHDLIEGRYDSAEPLFRRAVTINESALGPDHPRTAFALNDLGRLYFAQRDWVRATEYLRRGTGLLAQRTRRQVQAPTRRRGATRQDGAAKAGAEFAALVKAGYRHNDLSGGPAAALAGEMFVAAQLTSRSEAAESLAQMAARQAKGKGELGKFVRRRQDLVQEWRKRDALRIAAAARPPSQRSKKGEAANVKRLAAIEKQINDIDRRLAVAFPDYAALSNPEPLSVAQVQKHLKADEALVLFLDTSQLKPVAEETFVWVVTRQSMRWVRSELGTKALKERVDALRCGLDFDGAWKGSRCFDLLNVVYTADDQAAGKPLPYGLTRAHELYRSLFGKVEDLISGKSLLVVPSGALTQLPFQVLVKARPSSDALTPGAFTKADWLVNHHAMTVLPSVSSLRALRGHTKPSSARRPFIGIGNPLLTGPDDNDKSAWQKQSCPPQRFAFANFRTARGVSRLGASATQLFHRGVANVALLRRQYPLPETADELCAVARAVGAASPNDVVLLGAKAREKTLKKLSAAGRLADVRVLHFATHGLVAGETASFAENRAEPALLLTPPARPSATDDGLLTASEVTTLKLDADWVILSACNTAAGGARNADALSGLARAFFYAGARALLVSHWYVDSHATVALIRSAFDHLNRNPKLGRAEALRRAMRALIRADSNTWHPAAWAPFVVVGEGVG